MLARGYVCKVWYRCVRMVRQLECYMLHILVSLRLDMIIRSAAERSNYHTIP